MHLIEVLEGCGHLRHHRSRIGKVHAADVVARLNVFTKLSAMPLLWGLHTGVLTGLRPSCRAICRVSAAM
jgi:hypothetical protein